ncbi:MAG: DF family (seleno)protein [Anaerolineae bacterium]
MTFLYYEDCPSHDEALARLRQIMAEEGIEADVQVVKVETDEQAAELRFVGSPTIRVAGQDIDPPPADAQFALTCRAYRREDGRITPLPPAGLIRRALRAAAGR